MRYNLYAQHGCCKTLRAFTLLELLLVIAVIASLAGVILSALNPAARLQSASDTKSVAKSNELKKAIQAYTLDNSGSLPPNILSLSTYGIYDVCKQGQSTNCVNLDVLVTNGYLSEIPTDSEGASSVISGYKIEYDPSKTTVNTYSTDALTSYVQNGATLTKGLVGYWKMDEAAANTCTGGVNDSCDSSGYGNNLAWSGDTTVTAGRYSNGIVFDGTGDYMSKSDSDILDIGSGSMTWSLWYKTSQTGRGGLYRKSDGGNANGVFIDINNGAAGRPACQIDTTINLNYISATYNNGSWHQVICTLNRINQTVNLYVDGQLVNSTAYTSNVSLNAISGSDFGLISGFYLTGAIDEFRIFNRALHSEEITALYNYAPSPIAQWKFDEGSGTTAADSSRNGNNGTLTNGPTWTSGKYGSAVNFDGTNDNVIVSDPVGGELDFGNRSFTTMAWVKIPSGLTSYYQVIGKKASYNSSTIGWQFWLDFRGSPVLSLRVNDGSAAGDITPGPAANLTSLFNGNWRHVAIVVNVGVNATYYVDGISYGTAGLSSMPGSVSNSEPVKIGGNGGDFFPGQIDDVRVYNYAMTQAQIQKVMNNEI